MTDEVAGVEFAELENDGLENDGLDVSKQQARLTVKSTTAMSRARMKQ